MIYLKRTINIMEAKRVSSGVPGLDSLMQGGFLPKSTNLVTGETGTGKTIFCCQFLWHGLQKGETGVYITLEEDPDDIKEDAMDFEKYENKGLCKVIYHDPAQVNNLASVVIEEIKRVKAKRLVIDSTSVMALNIQESAQIRKMLLNIINTIKKTDCVAILTSEITEESKALSRFGVEEFVVDGVLLLNYLEYATGNLNRSIIIRKMRRTNHGTDIYPIGITSKGFVVKKVD
jgi:circadian clock protein KaiC